MVERLEGNPRDPMQRRTSEREIDKLTKELQRIKALPRSEENKIKIRALETRISSYQDFLSRKT